MASDKPQYISSQETWEMLQKFGGDTKKVIEFMQQAQAEIAQLKRQVAAQQMQLSNLAQRPELKLIVFDSFKEMGERINHILMDRRQVCNSFIIPIDHRRFASGEDNVIIGETTNAKDLFYLSDFYNRSITYSVGKPHNEDVLDKHLAELLKMITSYRGKLHIKKEAHIELLTKLLTTQTNVTTPKDHYIAMLLAILADQKNAARKTIITPTIMDQRQHRRNKREPLSSPYWVQLYELLGVSKLVTCDTHSVDVKLGAPNFNLQNVYATNELLELFIDRIDVDDLRKLVIVATDTGARDRAEHLVSRLSVDGIRVECGNFYKVRDYDVMEEGRTKIAREEYSGDPLVITKDGDKTETEGKTIVLVDDMIASGTSILNAARLCKEKGASKVIIIATYGYFSEGKKPFVKAYHDGIVDAVIVTNLSNIPDHIAYEPWLEIADMAPKLARLIDGINKNESLSPILDEKTTSTAIRNKFGIKGKQISLYPH